jgi:hypothetical protein
MTLLQAHRILIGAATAFFALYAVWEFSGAGGPSGVWRGAAAFLAACGLGVYFWTIGGRLAPPGGGREGGEP